MIRHISQRLESFTHSFAKWAGSTAGFLSALASIILWLVIGRPYGYSTGWENALMIYTGIITFLMVFLMQRSQRKELSALHLKLNELVVASQHADNSIIAAEELTEQEISEVVDMHRKIGAGKEI